MPPTLKRALSLASVLLAATGFGFVLAGPAQADQGACTGYLSGRGYVVGPGVLDACRRAESGPFGQVACTTILLSLGVAPGDAGEACRRGGL